MLRLPQCELHYRLHQYQHTRRVPRQEEDFACEVKNCKVIKLALSPRLIKKSLVELGCLCRGIESFVSQQIGRGIFVSHSSDEKYCNFIGPMMS